MDIKGVWVVWNRDNDFSRRVVSVHRYEIDALRVLNGNLDAEGVEFLEFGDEWEF